MFAPPEEENDHEIGCSEQEFAFFQNQAKYLEKLYNPLTLNQ